MSPYPNLSVSRKGNVFIITMRKAPENRINSSFAQELIGALRDVEAELNKGPEGAVIITSADIEKGKDAKFWCTVHAFFLSSPISPRCN